MNEDVIPVRCRPTVRNQDFGLRAIMDTTRGITWVPDVAHGSNEKERSLPEVKENNSSEKLGVMREVVIELQFLTGTSEFPPRDSRQWIQEPHQVEGFT